MRVNIGPGKVVEMTGAEAAAYWSKGILPDAFKDNIPKLANGQTVRNEYEAYWAAQPPEVQALMSLTSEAEKDTLAHDLADKGYKIDVPIMVWGWDPLSTMVVRRNQGFTWVPSANMSPVSVGPGLTFPGLPSYDPNTAPAGAIEVTTKWAKGFENTSPWMQGVSVELF